MFEFYRKSQFEEKFTKLSEIKDKKSNEYFFSYMMIILSYGRPVRLSEFGYDEGRKLYKKWLDGEELSREECILVGFLLTDISVLDEDSIMVNDLRTIYNQMITKHKPDFAYLQEFGQKHLLDCGYVENNPHYMQTIEQMFTTDMVLPDSDHVRMINTGEMPIYDDVKVCPYCGKQFGEDVEQLFKHVKSEHDKK